MTTDFIFALVRSLKKELRKNEATERTHSDSSGSTVSGKLVSKLDHKRDDFKSLIDYYEFYNNLLIKWQSKNTEEIGSINILSLDKVLIDYKDFVYFDHTPEDSPLRDFKIIDFFADEACVGIYTGRDDLPGMHFFEFENEAYPLHVDFEGYLKLLSETKGYLYWQKVILDHLNKKETPITKEFKENMPKLFDDFEFENFIELYETVRIDKS